MTFKTLALSLITLCLISSCTDDPTIEEQLIGDWTRSSLEIKECDDNDADFPLTNADADGCLELNDNTFACSILNFIAGGTGSERSTVNGDLDINPLTYNIDTTTDILTICNIDGDCFMADINKNTLTFNFKNDENCSITIEYTR